MIVQRLDYQIGTHGRPGFSRLIEIERPADLSDPGWQDRFRHLAIGVMRQAAHDLCHGDAGSQARARQFLLAAPGDPEWPMLEHWWAYLNFGSLTHFQTQVAQVRNHLFRQGKRP